MKNYRDYFLNNLLDKYENSLLYRGDNQVHVTISYKFNKRNIPEYYDAFHYQYKEQINEIVKNIEVKSYIEIVWEKYEEGNLIKQINLNIDKAKEIYRLLSRFEKKEFEQDALSILKPYMNNQGYMGIFVREMVDTLENGKSISKYLDITKPKQIEDVLFTLEKILIQEEEISKRVFSIQLFNNSKYFESIENKILKIMEAYGNYIDVDNMLSEENILRNPGYIYLKGNGTFKVGAETIDLSLISGEIGLSSRSLKHFEVIELKVNKVITIENLTSFHNYNKQDELIIYLGGFHNKLRENFLKSIYKFNENIKFFHWSDIDLGGFRIYHNLKKKTNIPFIPYLMDKKTLIKYEQYAMPITSKTYLYTLKELLVIEEYQHFKDVISYMICQKIRLEQEIITES